MKKKLSSDQSKKLLQLLESRFQENMHRHKGTQWTKVEAKLNINRDKLWSLNEMEISGGEPDLIKDDPTTNEFIFYDCSAESPKARRSVCYDKPALDARKEHKPKNNALDLAAAIGIEILTEDQYRELQKFGEFDTKTSTWIYTPPEIRNLGGALFADRRYNQVFVYHNGASSYYAARGFRGLLRI